MKGAGCFTLMLNARSTTLHVILILVLPESSYTYSLSYSVHRVFTDWNVLVAGSVGTQPSMPLNLHSR